MLPQKPLLGGAFLLLLGLTGFLAVAMRTPSPVITSGPQNLFTGSSEAFPAKPTPVPIPKHDLVRKIHQRPSVPTAEKLHNPRSHYRPPVIKLISPVMGTMFIEPREIAISADVIAGSKAVSKVEFLWSEASDSAKSVCLNGILESDDFHKLGEATTSPYKVTWNQVSKGDYLVYAIATDTAGVRQASRPVLIIVREKEVQLPEGFEILELNAFAGRSHGKEVVRYQATLTPSKRQIVTCPLNPKDSLNSETRVRLVASVVGVYRKKLTYKYHVSGGNLTEIKGRFATWDLGGVPPGDYTAFVEVDDGNDCVAVAIVNIEAINHCYKNCVSVSCILDPDPLRKLSDALEKKSNFVDKPHKLTPLMDLSGPSPTTDQKGEDLLYFKAFVRAGVKDKNLTYTWSTSSGEIVDGQGTDFITIDTSKLESGTEVTAKVEISGLFPYCTNTGSETALAGYTCQYRSIIPLSYKAQRVHLVGVDIDKHVHQAGVDTDNHVHRARDVSPKLTTGSQPPDETRETVSVPSIERSITPTATPLPKETETIEVKWPPKIYVDETSTVTVIYNRTTELTNIPSAPGDIGEVLDSIKDRFGADYEARVKAELKAQKFTCEGCKQEQFKSLDQPRLVWSWIISPTEQGSEDLYVHLSIEWRNRKDQKNIKTEEIWITDKNKDKDKPREYPVQVLSRILTKNTVLISSALFCFLGTGLSIRSIHQRYRANVAPMTTIQIGEMVMGHSGDIFNTQQAGAVGPHAHAHDMNFNQIWNQSSQEISLPTLANDLAILRAALKKEATEPEHDVAIGSVAAAEKAAKEGNGAKALEHLKAAGEWALKVATSIGVPVAIEALKKVLGG